MPDAAEGQHFFHHPLAEWKAKTEPHRSLIITVKDLCPVKLGQATGSHLTRLPVVSWSGKLVVSQLDDAGVLVRGVAEGI